MCVCTPTPTLCFVTTVPYFLTCMHLLNIWVAVNIFLLNSFISFLLLITLFLTLLNWCLFLLLFSLKSQARSMQTLKLYLANCILATVSSVNIVVKSVLCIQFDLFLAAVAVVACWVNINLVLMLHVFYLTCILFLDEWFQFLHRGNSLLCCFVFISFLA